MLQDPDQDIGWVRVIRKGGEGGRRRSNAIDPPIPSFNSLVKASATLGLPVINPNTLHPSPSSLHPYSSSPPNPPPNPNPKP